MKDRNQIAVLLLGSNKADRTFNLTRTIHKISIGCGTIIKCSSVYETSPWGYSDQPFFFNQCLVIETVLSPQILLKSLKNIEVELGRTPSKKWHERIIDIDILFYDSQVISEPGLIVPHPMIPLRKFTLTPLNEVIPDFIHPVLNKTMNQLLENCIDDGVVNGIQNEKTENAY